MNNNYIVIMAGGVGSRFWPASTEELPKQFLDILGTGKSLLRHTFERFSSDFSADHIFIVTNEKYKALCQEHIPELPGNNILLEPSRNNTAPSIAYTALRLKAINPDAVFTIVPSDHVILKEKLFLDKIKTALDFASQNEAIVTLGITPTRPDTGYGYIETATDGDIREVASFKEKPNLETAQEYLAQGKYLWNAGIFIWSVNTILTALEKYAPEIMKVLDSELYNTEKEQDFINENYPNTPEISIDYAVLENSNNVYTIPSDIGWSDLGTWNSLYSYLNNENSVIIGNAECYDVKDSIIYVKDGRRTIIKGLENMIVVSSENGLLIYPKDLEQEVKQKVKNAKK